MSTTVEPQAQHTTALQRAADRWRFAACLWYADKTRGWIGAVTWGKGVPEYVGKAHVAVLCERSGMSPTPQTT